LSKFTEVPKLFDAVLKDLRRPEKMSACIVNLTSLLPCSGKHRVLTSLRGIPVYDFTVLVSGK